MSTRQSREELIKKGVLKEVYEKGDKKYWKWSISDFASLYSALENYMFRFC